MSAADQQGTPDIPSGVVTFLFTDIEGSTGLWATDEQAMSASLSVHDRVMRAAIDQHRGYVFTTAGDSFAVAFADPDRAIEILKSAQSLLVSPKP